MGRFRLNLSAPPRLSEAHIRRSITFGVFAEIVGACFDRAPPLQLTTPAAQVLGMALHELATNASKYGSLSNETGRVHISWRSAPIEDRFEIEWVESGGPIVATPRRKGFGSVVMDKMARLGLSADIVLEFAPKGLIWRLACAREAALYVPPTAAGLEIAKS
jgi:two-component sensor histidine kinase